MSKPAGTASSEADAGRTIDGPLWNTPSGLATSNVRAVFQHSLLTPGSLLLAACFSSVISMDYNSRGS
jgi:hypothetical protein